MRIFISKITVIPRKHEKGFGNIWNFIIMNARTRVWDIKHPARFIMKGKTVLSSHDFT